MFEFLKKLVKKKPLKKLVVKPKPKKPLKKLVVKPKPKKPLKKLVVKPKPKKPLKKLVVKPKASKGFFSFTDNIKSGLKKTREKLNSQLTELFSGNLIDESLYEELETILLTADVGISATSFLISQTKESVKNQNIKEPAELKNILKFHLVDLLKTIEKPLYVDEDKPYVIMVVGVNGTGKTTSIGKLTKLFQKEGKKILIGAGDTFRAAAVEQLSIWGERNGVTVITQKNADPSAVIFDAVSSAKAKNIDIVLADTAGRLPTQKNLIDEIAKIKKVITKCHQAAPQEILLVIDANTGQNAIEQLKAFNEAIGVTGLIITKLDGTAKGGIIAAIAKDTPTPLRFIGVGEGIDDLKPFNAKDYVEAMFE